MALTEEQKMDVALFRFGLIAPLLNNQVEDPRSYLEMLANQVFDVPHLGRRDYCTKTIRCWLWDYRRDNIEGLKPQNRSDRGTSRVISTGLGESIMAFRKDNPALNVKLLYEQLICEGIMLKSEVSYHSLYRFLKERGLSKPLAGASPVKDRRPFAYQEVNRLWQGDMMVGPRIMVAGKKKPAYLFAFIDDASRMVYGEFTLEQDFDAMKNVYIETVLRRGIPQVVYLDNGKVYRSKVFHAACAAMGTVVSHTEPYDAASKGKIERFFRTVRERFLVMLPMPVSSLEELNTAFGRWLEEDYHRRVHSALGMSPLDKYLTQAATLRVANNPGSLNRLFMKRETRRVNNDATISVSGTLFEVSPALIGQRVEVRFDSSLSEVLVYQGDAQLECARPVNLIENAQVKRNRENQSQAVLSFHEALIKREEV
jgi:transposase InsO family protein